MAGTDWMSRAKQIGIESFWYKEYSNLSLIEIMDRTMDGETLYLDKPPAVFLGKLKITDLTVQQKIFSVTSPGASQTKKSPRKCS